MTPLTEHQLLIFWVQLALLVATARGLGGLMRRIGQPSVVGELAAGLVIGPSLLGQVAPEAYGFLFPDDPVQSGLLLAVSWIGVALLMVVTGFETDLKLLANLGRHALLTSIGSLVVPLVLGVAIGLVLPVSFLGDVGSRPVFAAFMAVALAVSALPVVARVLMDMGLMRRNIGQVTVAGGMANDLVGWLLLGALAGIVTSGGFDPLALGVTVTAMAAFIAGMLTVGQRLVDAALRRARQTSSPTLAAFTAAVLVSVGAGALTQAIGVEAVLGAFVAGVVIGRSRYRTEEVTSSLETVTHGFFAPVFFATAGLFVDLSVLSDPVVLGWTLALVAVATLAKLVGAYGGGLVAGMPRLESLAVGVGLNARGAVGVVIATVGLSLGILSTASYTGIVVVSIATSLMAPPLLRVILQRIEAGPDEAQRLRHEEVLSASVVASTRTALLPTRGGVNSLLAGRLLDASLQPDATVTIYTVHPEGDDDGKQRADVAAREMQASFTGRRTERLDKTAAEAAEAICRESALGYGLVALGLTEDFVGSHELSPALQRILTECHVPMLLVRHSTGGMPLVEPERIRRITVPATGTRVGQAAQEIAFTLANNLEADIDVVHVVDRPDRASGDGHSPVPVGAGASAVDVLAAAQDLAERYGHDAGTITRTGSSIGQELAAAADDAGADLLVIGAQVRSRAGRPFLGHNVEYVLEHASTTVLVIVFPT